MILLNRLSSTAAAGLLLVLAAGEALAADPAPAFIRVTLPAAASLRIDGAPTTSTTAERVFVTPPLEPGRDFYYTVQAEFERGEQTVTVGQRVAVRAGRETTVSLLPPAASAWGGEPGRAESSDYYYSPGTPGTGPSVPVRPLLRSGPISPPGDDGIGGARDNWKPDSADPFLRGPG